MSGIPSTLINSACGLGQALGRISCAKTPEALFETLSKTLHELADYQPVALYRRMSSGELRLTYCYPATSATITSCNQLFVFRSLDDMLASKCRYYALKGEHGVWGYIGHPSAPSAEALDWINVVIDIAAQRLRLLKAEHMAKRQLSLKAQRRILSRDIKRLTSLEDCLRHHGHEWCDIFQSDGIALVHKTEVYCFGECPDRQRLLSELGQQSISTDLESTVELDGDCRGGLAAPLNMASHHLGWLLLFRKQPAVTPPAGVVSDLPLSRWLPIEASMVLELADDLAVAITALEVVHVNRQLRKTNQRLESLAHTDLLTRCWNRYYTEHVIEELCATHATCAILMFDIDDFKRINDTYGHAVGDDILREIARVTRELLRSDDHLGRWGGEEFIVVIANALQQQGTRIARRLCQHIKQHPFCIPDAVTISAGVTRIQEGDTPHQLLERVDQGMYLAKAAGKNQVVVC